MTSNSNHTEHNNLKDLSLALWRIQRTRENSHQQSVHRQLMQRQHHESSLN